MDDKSALIEESGVVIQNWPYLHNFLDSSSATDGGGGSSGGGYWKLTERERWGYFYFDDGDVIQETTRANFCFESIMFGFLWLFSGYQNM